MLTIRKIVEGALALYIHQTRYEGCNPDVAMRRVVDAVDEEHDGYEVIPRKPGTVEPHPASMCTPIAPGSPGFCDNCSGMQYAGANGKCRECGERMVPEGA